MNVLPVPRLVYGGYFVHVPTVYLQCTSPVHHPLPPVNSNDLDSEENGGGYESYELGDL